MSTRIINLIAGTALLGIAVVSGGTANASAQDDRFLQIIRDHGIEIVDPAQGIQGAHQICDQLGTGYPGRDIVTDLSNTGQFTVEDAITLVNAAITVYCPGHAFAS